MADVRAFASGATRDTDSDKLVYEAFLSPRVLRRYAEYMHKHRTQANGTLRSGDNWQKGIPLAAYQDSLVRHTLDAWYVWRRDLELCSEMFEDLLCAIMFNAMGMLHELLKKRDATNEH